jgi:hypothetical protein
MLASTERFILEESVATAENPTVNPNINSYEVTTNALEPLAEMGDIIIVKDCVAIFKICRL